MILKTEGDQTHTCDFRARHETFEFGDISLEVTEGCFCVIQQVRSRTVWGSEGVSRHSEIGVHCARWEFDSGDEHAVLPAARLFRRKLMIGVHLRFLTVLGTERTVRAVGFLARRRSAVLPGSVAAPKKIRC